MTPTLVPSLYSCSKFDQKVGGCANILTTIVFAVESYSVFCDYEMCERLLLSWQSSITTKAPPGVSAIEAVFAGHACSDSERLNAVLAKYLCTIRLS